MTEQTPERRQAPRLPVPWEHYTQPGLDLRWGRLLDLSFMGARIESLDLSHEGCVCEVELPPFLGWCQLISRIVWTRPRPPARTLEGDTRVHYQSGLVFVDTTPEERLALAVALEILKTEFPD